MDKINFDRDRFETFYALLLRAASGDSSVRQPLTEERDELDAASYAVNALVDELNYRVSQAEKANQSKTQFLRNISHELRTPLTAILAAADILNRDGISHAQRDDLLATIKGNGQNLLHMISDLIDLSKTEAGQFRPEIKAMCVQDWLKEVVDSMRPAALKKNLGFRLEISKDVPDEILSCSQSLRQILVNLIGNAIKFTAEGEVNVSVGFDTDPIIGPCLITDVRDTGIGIEAAAQGQLFQPFVQANEKIGKKFGGSGLGLALSLRLAEALGGDLCLLQSDLGRGSTFRMKIPNRAGTSLRQKQRLTGTRILLAEDNPEIREIFETILTIEGAAVTSVADGREALTKAAGHTFDIVLLDVNMPKMSGSEAVQELRQRGYKIPVLAVTADEISEEPLTLMKMGFDDGISKPFAVDSVCNKIVRHCRLPASQSLPQGL